MHFLYCTLGLVSFFLEKERLGLVRLCAVKLWFENLPQHIERDEQSLIFSIQKIRPRMFLQVQQECYHQCILKLKIVENTSTAAQITRQGELQKI